MLRFCWNCRAGFEVKPYVVMVKKKGKFCSRECYMEAVRNGFNKGGRNHPNYGKHWPKKMRQQISKSLRGKNNPMYGKQLSAEHRKRIGDAQRGSKHRCWKGGITPLRKKLYFKDEYKEWRKAVFERDDYTCSLCGQRGSTVLHAHHILPWQEYPILRFVVDNGITLCKDCHYIIEALKKRGVIFQPLPKIAPCQEKSDMTHTLNSVKPLRKRGNTEPSQLTLEGVETVKGTPFVGEDTVQTTNILYGSESYS